MIEKTADWTLHPIAERELTEEHRHRLARRRAGWLLYLSTYILPSSCLIAGSPHGHATAWFGYLSLAASLLIGAEFYRRINRNILSRRQRQTALREEYQNAHDGWIIDLTIYQGATATGRDQGLLWFENGRLFFSGHRTSFALAASEIAEARYNQAHVDEIRSSIFLRFSRSTAAGNLAVGFDVVPSAPKSQGKTPEGLAPTLENFREQNLARETQWPPLIVGPSLAPARMLFFRAAASTAYWLYIGYTILTSVENPAILIVGLIGSAIVAGLCPEVWFPLARWRSFLDRRRLDRSLRQNNQQ